MSGRSQPGSSAQFVFLQFVERGRKSYLCNGEFSRSLKPAAFGSSDLDFQLPGDSVTPFRVVLSSVLAVMLACGCSKSPDELFHEGLKAYHDGNNQVILDCIDQLNDSEHGSDFGRILQALISERGEDYQTALHLLEDVDPNGDARPHVLLTGGRIYAKAGILIEAERLLGMYTQEFPDDAEGHRWAGIVYYDLGAYDFAIVHLQRVAELLPSDFRPYRLIGLMYSDFERNEEAIEILTRGIDTEPPEHVRIEMLEQLGRALINLHRYRDAAHLLTGETGSATLLAHQAAALRNLNQTEAAWKAIEDSLALDPGNRDALLTKAELLKSTGKQNEAVTVLENLVADDPFYVEARYQLALSLTATGHKERAQREMSTWEQMKQDADELTKLNVDALSRPFDAELRLKIADLCDRLGKTELAAMWRRIASSIENAAMQPKAPLAGGPARGQ